MSLLDERGQPTIVERAFVVPPRSQIGPIAPDQRKQLLATSLVAGIYEQTLDRESAYERLGATHAKPPAIEKEEPGFFAKIFGGGSTPPARPAPGRGRQPEGLGTTMAKSAVRTIGSSIGREIVRGILGSIFGGRRR